MQTDPISDDGPTFPGPRLKGRTNSGELAYDRIEEDDDDDVADGRTNSGELAYDRIEEDDDDDVADGASGDEEPTPHALGGAASTQDLMDVFGGSDFRASASTRDGVDRAVLDVVHADYKSDEKQLVKDARAHGVVGVPPSMVHGRPPGFDPTRPLDLAALRPPDKHRERILAGIEGGYTVLLQNVLSDVSQSAAMKGDIRQTVHIALWHIFLSVDSEVFESIVNGNLAARYRSSSNCRYALNALRNRARHARQPVIYLNTLADVHGEAPSIGIVLDVLHGMEEYICQGLQTSEAINFALAVDKAFEPPAARLRWSRRQTLRGDRKYMQSEPGSSTWNIRAETIRVFVRNVRARIAERLGITEEGLEDPTQQTRDAFANRLDPPFTEVGYTAASEERLKSHRMHRSSNFIMNLFEAVCAARGFPFSIHQFVIYLIWQPSHAAVAEIFFTILANGMIANGSGFSFYAPGCSVNSAYRIPKGKWMDFTAWAYNHSPHGRNDEEEVKRMDAAARMRDAAALERVKTSVAAALAGSPGGATAPDTARDREETIRELAVWLVAVRCLYTAARMED